MANVLPLQHKKTLWHEQRARLVLAASLAALLGATLAFAALLPAYIVLRFGSPDTAFSAVPAPPGIAKDRANVKETQALVIALHPLIAATTTPTQAIAVALALKPAGIAIDHITYTAGTSGQLLISGVSPTPGTINAYRTALAADPHFSSASVPVGALIGSDNGRFTVTLAGTF